MKPTLSALTGTRVQALIRLVLLTLCAGVVLARFDHLTELLWAAALGGVGLLASRSVQHRSTTLVLIAVEGALSASAVAATGAEGSAFLPYLIAPAFAGGLAAGFLGGLVPLGAGATALLIAPLVSDAPEAGRLSADIPQWMVLAVLVALVAAWVRTVLLELDLGLDPRVAQREAFRLLTELRTVTRHMPGTLDPATSAEVMLGRARRIVRFDTGAILVAAGGGQKLALVARIGSTRPSWDLSLAAESPLTECWMSQQPQLLQRQLTHTNGEPPHRGSALVVPLLSGGRSFGLLALETGVAQAFSAETAGLVNQAVAPLALQLQTGLVFDEIRELATYEERRRLAREIHDGIAQELASLGYALDGVSDDLRLGREAQPHLDEVRDEVRRLVSELRMSLFDLRSDVQPDEGLGAAIGRHVRAVGTASGLTVHLSLNEAPTRLAAEIEAELLRIVQEAVANARKHAKAKNLWVACTVDPPTALLTIEDDGIGVTADAGPGSHGLAIMQERAHRIRADLKVQARRPRGTTVSLTLDRVRT